MSGRGCDSEAGICLPRNGSARRGSSLAGGRGRVKPGASAIRTAISPLAMNRRAPPAANGALTAPGTAVLAGKRRCATGASVFAYCAVGISVLITLVSLHINARAQPASIAMEEIFRIGEEGDDLVFGNIARVASDARGRIYVADYQNPVVHVFSTTGALISTIGGPGEGPGEFEDVDDVVVGPNGKVYVWDGWLVRLSIFEERASGEFEFSDMVSIAGHNGQVPSSILGVGSQGMVFLYITPYGFCDECSNTGTRSLNAMLVDENGQAVGEPLVTLPSNERVEVVRQDGVTVKPKPFGSTSTITMSASGMLYSGWSDAINIRARSLSGDKQKTFRRDYAPLPVTRRELNAAVEDWSREEREALRKSGMPRIRPVFKNFVVDDNSCIWVQTSAATGEATAECIVIGPDGADVAAVSLPATLTLKTIRGGKAVGVLQEKGSGPVIVAYTVSG